MGKSSSLYEYSGWIINLFCYFVPAFLDKAVVFKDKKD